MPRTSARAAVARPALAHPAAASALLRLLLGTAVVFAALSLPLVVTPDPVAASSSCTGWTSKSRPPQSIRVLRTHSGQVERVEFRRYVAEVMASGEWPSHLGASALEAGALATKQYAWYYALKGHHRPHYISGGECYDVRDDTMDQLYRPEGAVPTARQWRAIDQTWNLTLRKYGRFFLTGYRAGAAGACGADANGWKLYAKSVNACSRQGWSSRRILSRYFSPNVSFVWSGPVGPVLKTPRLTLRVGNDLPGAVTVSWKPVGQRADVTKYKLQRKLGKGGWKDLQVADRTAARTDVWLKAGVKNRFRVKAIDHRGNSGPWSYSSYRTPALRGPVGKVLASGGTRVAAVTPRQVKTRVRSRSLALVTSTGPGMGQVKILVDGKRVATVDLERRAAADRTLVWAKNWSRLRTRKVAVRAVDPARRVEFEGFYILR